MVRVAGVLVNIVPYHHARWEAFAATVGVECHVIELTNRDAFKILEFAAPATYLRHTLFPHDELLRASGAELFRRMAWRLDAIRPDVVCVSGWALPVSLAALAWAERNKVPIVVLSESNAFDEKRAWPKEFIKRQVVGLCSAALAGGTTQADYLAGLGLARSRIFLGYDAVDNKYYAVKVAEVRNAKEIMLCQREQQPFFIVCCRFGEKKNLPRLIEAYALYRWLAQKHTAVDHVPPWHLSIVGDGEKRPAIEDAITRCNVTQYVQLMGARSYTELPIYYGLASAFIHPSTTEQWGLVVNEAMASGLPVLVSNRCGCVRDLVKEGVNGFTFAPHSVEEMANGMLRIWKLKEGELKNMGAESARIVADWGIERFTSGLNQALQCAIRVGPIKASQIQRVISQILLLR